MEWGWHEMNGINEMTTYEIGRFDIESELLLF